MPIEIQWIDKDPVTGQRRYLHAEKWAQKWQFKWRLHRRADWTRGLEPTREIWEFILDKLRRRHVRREGVSDEDIEQVVRILRDWREPPSID
jgi:hypothetical protein